MLIFGEVEGDEDDMLIMLLTLFFNPGACRWRVALGSPLPRHSSRQCFTQFQCGMAESSKETEVVPSGACADNVTRCRLPTQVQGLYTINTVYF